MVESLQIFEKECLLSGSNVTIRTEIGKTIWDLTYRKIRKTIIINNYFSRVIS